MYIPVTFDFVVVGFVVVVGVVFVVVMGVVVVLGVIDLVFGFVVVFVNFTVDPKNGSEIVYNYENK